MYRHEYDYRPERKWPKRLLGGVVVVALGAAGLAAKNQGVFRSDKGATNTHVDGVITTGDCSKALFPPEYVVHPINPGNDTVLIGIIRNIATKCGFCVKRTFHEGAVNSGTDQVYHICVDPATLRDVPSTNGPDHIVGYLTTDPTNPRQDFVVSAFTKNPGDCGNFFSDVSGSMDYYFRKAFAAETLRTIIPEVHIAPGADETGCGVGAAPDSAASAAPTTAFESSSTSTIVLGI